MFKNPSFIFDIICTVVWLLLAVRYARKGFLAAVVQLTGNLVSLFGARQFSGWAAGQVFEQVFANSFRDQIAASISAEGAVSLSGIAAKYAGFLPKSIQNSIIQSVSQTLDTGAPDVAQTIGGIKSELLHGAQFVDEYHGKQVPDGKKSLTVRLVIGSREKTLTSAEIEEVAAGVIKKLVKRFGAELRSK